jgi:hypothetical protein
MRLHEPDSYESRSTVLSRPFPKDVVSGWTAEHSPNSDEGLFASASIDIRRSRTSYSRATSAQIS